MSLPAVEAEQAMSARIIAFFEKVTESFSYLVIDPPTQAAAIIDSVLDYDPAAGRIGTHSADAIAKMVQAEGLRVEWILETHVHADHLSAAGYLKKKLGGALGIGSNVRQVQRILGNLFNDKPAIPPGAGFDHLFEDGETFRVGTLDLKAIAAAPDRGCTVPSAHCFTRVGWAGLGASVPRRLPLGTQV